VGEGEKGKRKWKRIVKERDGWAVKGKGDGGV